jgi:hypothetical protein
MERRETMRIRMKCFETHHNLQLLWLMERDEPRMRRRKEKVL